MASVRLLPPALEDLERLGAFLQETDPAAAAETPALIFGGLNVLSSHPLIGRPAGSGLRELVIYRGRTGYLALYSYAAEQEEVLVVAIRHQREVDL